MELSWDLVMTGLVIVSGAPGSGLAQAAMQHGEKLNSAMKQAGNSQEAAAAVLSSHP